MGDADFYDFMNAYMGSGVQGRFCFGICFFMHSCNDTFSIMFTSTVYLNIYVFWASQNLS